VIPLAEGEKDQRILEWDRSPSDIPTKDKLYISVDLFARWRITDPLQYFLRLRDERSAQSRLDDILGSETRNAVAKHELIEIIRTTKDRVPLRDALLTGAEQKLDMGSLVPIQKGRKLVEQEIFTAAAKAYQEALFEQGIPITAFEVDDLESEFRKLSDLGVAFTSEPTNAGDVTLAVFVDTCGNLIQIYQPAQE